MDRIKELLALVEEAIYMNRNIPSLDSYYMIKKTASYKAKIGENKKWLEDIGETG